MRRITRIDRSIGLLRPRPIAPKSYAYRCSACRTQISAFSTSSLRGADKESFSQRVRRRLFKQTPSTSLDPYTGPSQLSVQEPEPEPEPEQKFEQEERIAAEDAYDYQPADNAEGLEIVGGYMRSESEECPYKVFISQKKVKGAGGATAALHRAIVEVFALRQAGRPLSDIFLTEPGPDITANVQINPSESGAILQFLEDGSLEQLIQSFTPVTPVTPPKKGKQRRKARLAATSSIDETTEKGAPTESEEDVAADRSPVDPLHPEPTPEIDETAEKGNPTESEEDVAADRSTVDPLKAKSEALVASWGNSWLQISLADPAIKFAVVKRVMQLTGVRIPDNIINSSSTAGKLLQNLIIPPKPPTLKEALDQEEELLSLPNVRVFGRRITVIDKERDIGRLKVIREQLRSQGMESKSCPSAWTKRPRKHI
ncbi:hypothetical protein DSL72_000551 [Monilinia vaccinii-corymbosi]|uniref:Large ribosomal subunit protein mL50 n=1 Tax=Monilinia vaccinii-corymbosi TaxID=61207 RepID=A0A8A3P353_9HELO|nr:hypothetical protein DSL72_000551 [Monilinia vaccinii-corymbosi]